MKTTPVNPLPATHVLRQPDPGESPDPAFSGVEEQTGASDGPMGPVPHLAVGIAAQRAKQALKARLFPERLELAPHIGRFTVLRELGRGGMGVVYMAYDETLDRRVALKLLYEMPGDDANNQTRLLREAQAMARLNHPNIAAVYEVGTHDERVFVAMEFVQGKPLDVWLRDGQHSWSEVVEVFIQAGRGLHAAHSAGLVHRDFKPANVMLGSDGRVRVLDFGLARGAHLLDPGAELGSLSTKSMSMPALAATMVSPHKLGKSMTHEGTIVGTPAYMPPEQFRGEPLDPRADQFALCVSLYEGLYGRLPFVGKTLIDLWTSVLAGPPRTAPRGSRVPTWLHRVLLRGLASDPAQRFPSMAALLAALERQPRKRLRSGLLATLIGGTLAAEAYNYAFGQSGNPQCQFENELAGLWDGETKSNLREVFERDESEQAMRAWVSAEALLDEHSGKLVKDRREACKAYQSGEDSALMYERRSYCFSKSRLAINATVTALSQLDTKTPDRVAQAAAPLALTLNCAHSSISILGVENPSTEIEDEVGQLNSEIYRIEAKRVDGITPTLLEASQEVVRSAKSIGYLPVVTDALRQRSALEWYSGLKSEACDTLRASYITAETAQYDATAALNALDIIEFCSDLSPHEQVVWAQIAVAKSNRSGFSRDIFHLDILLRTSIFLLSYSPSRDVENFLIEAIAIIEANPKLYADEGANAARLALLNFAIGRLLAGDVNDDSKARIKSHFARMLETLYPNETPEAAIARVAEQDFVGRFEKGDFAGARAVSELTIASLREAFPPDLKLIVDWQTHLADADLEMESCHDAVASVDRAMSEIHLLDDRQKASNFSVLSTAINAHSICGVLSKTTPMMLELRSTIDSSNPGYAWILNYSSALIDYHTNKRQTAAESSSKALSISEIYFASKSPVVHIKSLISHAEANANIAMYEAAKLSSEKAIALIEKHWGASHITLAAPLTVLGRIELEAKNVPTAVKHLERALLLREKSDLQFRAETAFALATALQNQPGSLARAKELGMQALREYEAAGPRRAAEHAEVKAWLATL